MFISPILLLHGEKGNEMRILSALAGLITAIVMTGILIAAVFAPPEKSVFRPSGVEGKNAENFEITHDGQNVPYSRYFVEFNDDGFYADKGQQQALLERIEAAVAREKKAGASPDKFATVILLYVHGLNHNANGQDNNVACFDELLKAAAIMQAKRDNVDVEVIGVYVGWPGLVYDNANLNSVVGWLGREAAADRVAERGDLLSLFTKISKLRGDSKSKHSRFVIIGHSLGGRAAYLALRSTMQRFAEDRSQMVVGDDRVADVTVFANPAFSAQEHDSLHRMMSAASSGPTVVPRFIMLTSESDEVLSGAFEAANKAASFFRGDYRLQQQARWQAAGSYQPYVTHHLELEGEFENPSHDGACPRLSADELGITRGGDRVNNPLDRYRFAVITHQGENGANGYKTVLKRIKGRSASETMVIRVDRRIIPNHNDVFTTPSVDFIARILNCGYWESDCIKSLDKLDEVVVED